MDESCHTCGCVMSHIWICESTRMDEYCSGTADNSERNKEGKNDEPALHTRPIMPCNAHTATHCNSLQHNATHCNTRPVQVESRRRAAHASVLQCVAVCCSVLQYVAVCCSVLQCVAMCCSVLHCIAVCCSMLQYVAWCCNVLQCVAVCCSVL